MSVRCHRCLRLSLGRLRRYWVNSLRQRLLCERCADRMRELGIKVEEMMDVHR